MLYPIERRTLVTFFLAVITVLLISWATLQNSPSAHSIYGIAGRIRDRSACLQQARAALFRAAAADQSARATGDNRHAAIRSQALAVVASNLERHELMEKGESSTRRTSSDISGLDIPTIQRLIDAKEADDTDFLQAASADWERRAVRFNATVVFASAVCVITMIGALCVALYREMCLRRQRDTAESEARERLANIMDTLPSAFLSVDDDLHVTYANGQACQLLSADPARILGRPLLNILPPDLAGQVERPCAEVMRTLTSQNFEIRDALSDHWYSVEVSPSPYGLCVHIRDISDAKRALETQERLLALLEATPDVVGIQDGRGFIYFNRAGREMFGGGNPTGALTRNDNTDPAENTAELPEDLFPIGLERGVYRTEKSVRACDGRTVPVSQVAIAHRDSTGAVAFVSTILRDISQRKLAEKRLEEQVRLVETYSRQLEEANAQLRALATTDGLTGVKNHRAFQEVLAAEAQRASRYGRPLSLVMLDVDYFKQYNDAYGHPAGDRVLRRIAQALQSCARATDTVARYGGEEFVVILPETDAGGAARMAERIRQAVESTPWDLRPVSASLGVATTPDGCDSAAALVDAADRALYLSKASGRNRVTHAAELEIESVPYALVGARQVA